MSKAKERMGVMHFLQFMVAFIISVYSVSSLMPLLLQTALRGLSLAGGISIIAYLLVASLSIGTLARMIYTLDRKAGRVRNRIGWFE